MTTENVFGQRGLPWPRNRGEHHDLESNTTGQGKLYLLPLPVKLGSIAIESWKLVKAPLYFDWCLIPSRQNCFEFLSHAFYFSRTKDVHQICPILNGPGQLTTVQEIAIKSINAKVTRWQAWWSERSPFSHQGLSEKQDFPLLLRSSGPYQGISLLGAGATLEKEHSGGLECAHHQIYFSIHRLWWLTHDPRTLNLLRSCLSHHVACAFNAGRYIISRESALIMSDISVMQRLGVSEKESQHRRTFCELQFRYIFF